MKILITSDTYFPRMGGAEVYAYKLGHFLQKQGHKVTVCTTEEGGDARDDEFAEVKRIVIKKSNILSTPKSFIALFKLVRESDLVHSVYSHKLAAIVGIIRFFIKTPQVVTLEGWGILDLPDNTFIFKQIHTFYRVVALKRASLVIASCKEFTDIALKYIKKDKIKYQPNSVDISEFNIGEKKYTLLPFDYGDQKIVATIRRLVPKNGIQFLVEAIPYIIKEYENVKFVLIGWGKLEKYLKNRVNELGVSKYVSFLGRIDNKVLPEYLNLADMVVFPSTAESTSIACLESMSLAKPIIASKVGGYLEMVDEGRNGFLVNLTDNIGSDYGAPMNISKDKLINLADRIVELLKSEEKTKKFGNNSRRIVEEKFSWQNNIIRIEEWYDTIK